MPYSLDKEVSQDKGIAVNRNAITGLDTRLTIAESTLADLDAHAIRDDITADQNMVGRLIITKDTSPFRLAHTSSSSYVEAHIANDLSQTLVLGSIGSTYGDVNWAGSTYVYNTGAKNMWIKSQQELGFFTGGTSLANKRLSIDAAGAAIFTNAVTVNGTLTATTLRAGDGTDGRFYSDIAGRTAFADGSLYIQTSVPVVYNYATSTYHGNTSGNAQYFRGNTLSGNSWTLTGPGVLSTQGLINADGGLSQDGHTILNGSDTWLRTDGATGWYSQTYGGGIRMLDTNYVEIYNTKKFKVNNTTNDSITTKGGLFTSKAQNSGVVWTNSALSVQPVEGTTDTTGRTTIVMGASTVTTGYGYSLNVHRTGTDASTPAFHINHHNGSASGTEKLRITPTKTTSYNNFDVYTTAPILVLQDSNSTGNAATGYMEFRDSANTRHGWMGFGSIGNDLLTINNDANSTTGVLINGNVAWHAGNANHQEGTSPIGTPRTMYTTVAVSNNSTTAGSNLRFAAWNATTNIATTGVTGTWKNVSGHTVSATYYAMFVRIS